MDIKSVLITILTNVGHTGVSKIVFVVMAHGVNIFKILNVVLVRYFVIWGEGADIYGERLNNIVYKCAWLC